MAGSRTDLTQLLTYFVSGPPSIPRKVYFTDIAAVPTCLVAGRYLEEALGVFIPFTVADVLPSTCSDYCRAACRTPAQGPRKKGNGGMLVRLPFLRRVLGTSNVIAQCLVLP